MAKQSKTVRFDRKTVGVLCNLLHRIGEAEMALRFADVLYYREGEMVELTMTTGEAATLAAAIKHDLTLSKPIANAAMLSQFGRRRQTKAQAVTVQFSRRTVGILCDLLYRNEEVDMGRQLAEVLYQQADKTVTLTMSRKDAVLVMTAVEIDLERLMPTASQATLTKIVRSFEAALAG